MENPGKDGLFGRFARHFVVPGVGGSNPLSHPCRKSRRILNLDTRRCKKSAKPSEHGGAVLVNTGHVDMHSPGAGPTVHDGRTASAPCAVTCGAFSIATTSQLLESPIPAQQRARSQAPPANPATPSENQTTGTSTLRQESRGRRSVCLLRRRRNGLGSKFLAQDGEPRL